MFCFPNFHQVIFSKELQIMHTYMHVRRTTFERTVLWSTITCSEMGKQNIQAKKNYSALSVYSS